MSLDAETLDYHARHSERLGSTKAFGDFIAPLVSIGQNILDVGCGAGQPTKYLADRFYACSWYGCDQSKELIKLAADIPGIGWMVSDLNNLQPALNISGVTGIQLLSWMEDYERPLEQICTKINPKWMAFSCLLYGGEISTKTIVSEPKRPRESYYNVYSVPQMTRFVEQFGYRVGRIKFFEIDADLPVPENLDLMKTYTMAGLQFSGPLWLPWGFISFVKA